MGEDLRIMKANDQLEPTVFVIFGGGGDLTWRKLVPALFDLSQDRSMPADFSVIAVDRVPMSDEKLRQRLHNGVNQFSRFGKAKDAAWQWLMPVLGVWAEAPPSDFPNYAAGTWEPEEAQGLLAQGQSWPLPTELVEKEKAKTNPKPPLSA
jgi:glucose-6-phosphate 1-dehydrogenase